MSRDKNNGVIKNQNKVSVRKNFGLGGREFPLVGQPWGRGGWVGFRSIFDFVLHRGEGVGQNKIFYFTDRKEQNL